MKLAIPRVNGSGLLKSRCNVYGGEQSTVRMLGGLGRQPTTRFFCPEESVGRFQMKCPHGHVGQIMPLCDKHYMQYRNVVSFCPACNAPGMVGHKCRIALFHIS
jgi:hypothetical protein